MQIIENIARTRELDRKNEAIKKALAKYTDLYLDSDSETEKKLYQKFIAELIVIKGGKDK